MAEARTEVESVSHPAPHRHRASASLLAFGLFAAPLAWGAQLVISYAMASHACYPGAGPVLTGSGTETVWSTLLIVELAAMAVALGGAAAAFAAWQATREEGAGDTEHMIELGRGRTRFLAVWGVITSFSFALAVGFSLLGVFTVPLCGS